jgi:nucleoside-diphosphate-sugar epimerase
MHTILGAGGPVANALTLELENNNHTVRLISRKPISPATISTTWQKADLLNYDQLSAAAKGSSIIYLCAGLVYDKDVWREQWPILMQNVIKVTKENNARLIFFDNLYMYGLVDGPMTEDTPYIPISEKGKIRAGIANMLMDEIKAGKIQATIARAADFYGTNSMNSFFDMMVLDKFAKKQTAQWMGDINKLHNFSYIPDMGKAMYLLGQHPESDNQVWHLPTAKPMPGKAFIELAAAIYNTKPKYMRINKLMLFVIGLFDKLIMSTVEMYYQHSHDYVFDSSKFEKAFNFKPTSYEVGIKHMAETLYKA